MTDLEYVKRKLDNNLYNLSEVALRTDISRSTLLNIKNDVKVKSYFIKLLAEFFRNTGE
jgi:hypothetical protein